MLVSLVTTGNSAKETISSAIDGNRGFAVSNNGNRHWNSQIQQLMRFNRKPTENDVMDAARDAGNSSVAKVLFQDMVNYKMEHMQNMASMWQTEMSAMGRAASISSQVAQSQDRMVQQFGQAAYQIGKSANYTQGVVSAYAQGLQQASAIM